MLHRFDEFEIDEARYELRRKGEVVPIRRRPFDLLVYLVRHRDVVVSKSDLMDNVWADAVVAKDALPHAMMVVRTALDDDVEQPRFIHTVRGRGYRFVAAVETTLPLPSPIPASGPISKPGGAPPQTLVGREAALAGLRTRIEGAALGSGGLVLVTGGAGLGKTTLLEAVASMYAECTISVRCYGAAGAPSLWPFAHALRELSARSLLDGHPVSPRLQAIQGLESTSLGNAEERFRTFEDVVLALIAAASGPLLLLVDDLERADEHSLELLAFLASRIRSHRILIVAAYRSGSVVHSASSFGTVTATLSSQPSTSVVTLAPFTKTDVADYLEQALEEPPSPAVIEKVHSKTKGNPLFVSQLVHVIRAEERLRKDEVATSSLVGDETMRAAILQHIAPLPESVVNVLTVAAVFGQTFSLAPLSTALGTSNADALRNLDAAGTARIVIPVGKGDFCFTYPLVRDVLYRRLPASTRVELHRRAAIALEEHLDGDEHANAGEIARHFVEAAATGEVDRAVLASLRAVELAERASNPKAAAKYAKRGLEAFRYARRQDTEQRARLLAASRLAD